MLPIIATNFPSLVTEIGTSAFESCTSLREVVLPSSLKHINNSTFRDCSSLVQINIPSSIQTIGDDAFNNCSSLSNVTIPSSAKSVGNHAFHKCTLLNDLNSDDNDMDKFYSMNPNVKCVIQFFVLSLLISLFAVFIVIAVWWSRIHPWFSHVYKTGKTV